MTLADSPAPLAMPENAVDAHLPCIGCQYDLFGQPRDGRCPECGRAVPDSLALIVLFEDPAAYEDVLSASRLLLGGAVLSGISVAATIGMLFALGSEIPVVAITSAILLNIVFVATLILTGSGGMKLSKRLKPVGVIDDATWSRMDLLDKIAGAGLMLLGLAAIVTAVAMQLKRVPVYNSQNYSSNYPNGGIREETVLVLGGAPACVGFLLLGLTTRRFRPTYQLYSGLLKRLGHPKEAGTLITLGWTKMIYEAIWLCACGGGLLIAGIGGLLNAGPFVGVAMVLAVVALFGLMGFAAIWVFMLVGHTIFARRLRVSRPQALGRGFDVIPANTV